MPAPLPAGATAVVTGASGFVGTALVRQLIAEGWLVRALARTAPAVDAAGVTTHVADVRDAAALRPLFDGADLVFHLAAKITLSTHDPVAWDVNVHGVAVVAETARQAGVTRLVHCSSVHAFDLSLARPRLDERSARTTDPRRPLYDRSKAAGEVELRRVIDRGLDATIVNPTGILGPGDPGRSRINAVIDLAARGRLPVVVTGGFDWVDVRDVAAGLVAAASRGVTGENYLLSGHRASTRELADLAAAVHGRRGPVLAVPVGLAHAFAPVGELVGRWLRSDAFTPASMGTLRDNPVVDGRKAAAVLGYAARPLEVTVRDTVNWYDGASGRVSPG